MHLSSWPVEEFKGLKPILDRLYFLCPTPEVQTHLLHLASHGYIRPHVDNIESSGSWILGVSLGAERILQLQKADNKSEDEQYRIALPSGSIYLQRLEAPSHFANVSIYFLGSGTTLGIIMCTALNTTRPLDND